jgi:hypothetical protein
LTRILIGSNDPGTLGSDVHELARLMGLPRANGDLGVVSYDEGYFHPKTYHFRRHDGTRSAYVGSANLTTSGADGLHVEAAIVLDSRTGDPADVLNQMAAAIDAWFVPPLREGFNLVTAPADIDRLVTDGVLIATRPPRQPRARRTGGGAGGSPGPRLHRLVSIPPLPPQPAPTVPVLPPAPAVLPQFAALQPFFPAPFVVDWSIVGPTHAAAALSGTPLPVGAVGLVVRLPRPVVKGILGQGGTPSLTVPMDTIGTLRFAVARARAHLRPWATFELRLRYLGGAAPLAGAPVVTNVLPYGYLPGETSHKEVRLRIPKQSLNLVQQIRRARLPLPSVGDFALLEWPTPPAPDFRLTFLRPRSGLFGQAQQLFTAANTNGLLVGDGACWLPAGMCPPW